MMESKIINFPLFFSPKNFFHAFGAEKGTERERERKERERTNLKFFSTASPLKKEGTPPFSHSSDDDISPYSSSLAIPPLSHSCDDDNDSYSSSLGVPPFSHSCDDDIDRYSSSLEVPPLSLSCDDDIDDDGRLGMEWGLVIVIVIGNDEKAFDFLPRLILLMMISMHIHHHKQFLLFLILLMMILHHIHHH